MKAGLAEDFGVRGGRAAAVPIYAKFMERDFPLEESRGEWVVEGCVGLTFARDDIE